MRVYLDMCCLKRPFDDQSQTRIHLESEAVLALMGATESIECVRAAALDLENAQNPLAWRATRVREWLESHPLVAIPDEQAVARTKELTALGFKGFDAFHLASAELGGAEMFCSCDDRLIATAQRSAASLHLRVANPVDLVRELLP